MEAVPAWKTAADGEPVVPDPNREGLGGARYLFAAGRLRSQQLGRVGGENRLKAPGSAALRGNGNPATMGGRGRWP